MHGTVEEMSGPHVSTAFTPAVPGHDWTPGVAATPAGVGMGITVLMANFPVIGAVLDVVGTDSGNGTSSWPSTHPASIVMLTPPASCHVCSTKGKFEKPTALSIEDDKVSETESEGELLETMGL